MEDLPLFSPFEAWTDIWAAGFLGPHLFRRTLPLFLHILVSSFHPSFQAMYRRLRVYMEVLVALRLLILSRAVASIRFHDSFSKLSFPVHGHCDFPSANRRDRTVPLCASIHIYGPCDGSHFWSVSFSFSIFFFKFQSIYLPILPSRLDLLNTYLSYHNLYLSAPLKITFGMVN